MFKLFKGNSSTFLGSILSRATICPPVKSHFNGVKLCFTGGSTWPLLYAYSVVCEQPCQVETSHFACRVVLINYII